MSAIKVQKDDKKIPKLRFPGFNEEWKAKELGEFLEQKTREIPKPNTPYKAIGIRSHFKGTFQKPDSDPDKIAMEKLFVVKQNDLIVNITFAWEGAVAMATEQDNDGLVSHRFPTYLFDEQKVSREYFRYVFPTKRFKYILTTISPGGAGRNRVLNKKDFLKIEIKLPALAEQQKISNFLDSVNKWIDSLKAQKEKLAVYKKGMMQKIFNQEIRFKDDNGNDFPEWEEKRLGDIADFSKGKGISKADIHKNGKNECIRYGELYTEYGEVINHIASRTDESKEKSVLSRENDILMPTSDVTPSGLATASALDIPDVILGGDILIIRSKGLLNKFFSYFVKANKKAIMRLVSGVTVYHIYGSDLKPLKIKVPSLSEQQVIADFLTSIDNLIQAKQTQITKAQSWEKGLMQQLFV